MEVISIQKFSEETKLDSVRSGEEQSQNKEIEPDAIIENSPFLNRTQESKLSIIVKWIMNFFIAAIQWLNVPGFIFLGITTANAISQAIAGTDVINNMIYKLSLIIFIIWLIIKTLLRDTAKNLVSQEVHLLWFINFKGKIKNKFFSIEKSSKMYKDTQSYMSSLYEETMRIERGKFDSQMRMLIDTLKNINDLDNYPTDTMEGLINSVNLINEYLTDIHWNHIDPNKPLVYDGVSILNQLLFNLSKTTPLKNYVEHMALHSTDYKRFICRANYGLQRLMSKKPMFNEANNFESNLLRSPLNDDMIRFEEKLKAENKGYYFYNDKKSKYNAVVGFPMYIFDDQQTSKYGVDQAAVLTIYLNADNMHETEKKSLVKLLKCMEN